MPADWFLSEFPPIVTAEWEAAIHKTLKGADIATLLWNAEDGLDLQAFYRAEDLAGLEFLQAAPGQFPYTRGSIALPGWQIREEIEAADPEEANRQARAAIASGAEEIAFGGTKITSASDLVIVFSQLEQVPLHFDADAATVRLLLERLSKRPHGAPVSTSLEPSGRPGIHCRSHGRSPGLLRSLHDQSGRS